MTPCWYPPWQPKISDQPPPKPKSQLTRLAPQNLDPIQSCSFSTNQNPNPYIGFAGRQIEDVGGGYGFAGVREILALVDQVHAGTRLAMFDREIFNFKLSDVNTKNLAERGYKTYKWSDFLNTQIEKKKHFSCQWSSWGKESNLWTLMTLQTRKIGIKLQTPMEFDTKMGLSIDNQKMRRLYIDLRFRFGRSQHFWY